MDTDTKELTDCLGVPVLFTVSIEGRRGLKGNIAARLSGAAASFGQ